MAYENKITVIKNLYPKASGYKISTNINDNDDENIFTSRQIKQLLANLPPGQDFLQNGYIFVGNDNNIAAGVLMNKDAVINDLGELTINDGVIDNNKLTKSNRHTWKGNNTNLSNQNIMDNNAGDIVELNSDILIITGNNNVLNPTSIEIKKSSEIQNGYLSSIDYNNFKNKTDSNLLDSYIYIGNSQNKATAQSIKGDLTLSNNGNLLIKDRAVTNQKLSQSDAKTWLGNNKYILGDVVDNKTYNLTETVSNICVINGANSLLNPMSIQFLDATSSRNGYLTLTDWNIFNNKANTNNTILTGLTTVDKLISNNIIKNITNITASSGTTTLTASSTQTQRFTGTLSHTIILPNATTLLNGFQYTIYNESTGTITIQTSDLVQLTTLNTNLDIKIILVNNSTSTGTWHIEVYPSSNGGEVIPVGIITAFYGLVVPTRWLLCDGSTFSAITYPDLQTFLGSTTLPDLRGYFLRGLDTTGTIDTQAARRLKSIQTDEFKAHNHTGTTNSGLATGTVSFTTDEGGNDKTNVVLSGNTSFNSSILSHTHSFTTNNTGGAETRPKNVAVNYIIKAK